MLKKAMLFSVVLSVIIFAATAFAEVKEVTYKSNMHCGACKSSIEKALNEYSGIESYAADVESNTVVVKFDDAKTNDVKIQKIINKAGYKADKMLATNTKSECTSKVSDSKSACCASKTSKTSASADCSKECASKCSDTKKVSNQTKESCCGEKVEIKNASLETKTK